LFFGNGAFQLPFPSFKLVKMHKLWAFSRAVYYYATRLFGQSHIKIGDKFREFILSILTWFWKGQLPENTGVSTDFLKKENAEPLIFQHFISK
jgi:hypothetical protein